MNRFCPIPCGLEIILDGKEGLGLEWDAPEPLPFTDDIDDSLVPVGLEILDLETTDLGLS